MPEYRAIIKDIFLLPELPSENNDKIFTDKLPKLLEYALTKSEELFPRDCRALLQCRKAISNFIKARETGKISESKVLKLLTTDSSAGKYLGCELFFRVFTDYSLAPIPLYLQHHNAGIIIRWGRGDRRIEAFQLSPRLNAVIPTIGRLRRQFPEVAVTIQKDTAFDCDFLQVIAETVAEMDKCQVPGLKPKRTRKGKDVENTFDATLPDHIFDALFGFLCTEASPSNDGQSKGCIEKRTRDIALYKDDTAPAIRRSPVWLLLKVVMQQELTNNGSPNDFTLYKQFMLFFHALLLDQACEKTFDSQTLSCMNRKVAYRMRKLKDKAAGNWMGTVATAVKKAKNVLETRWQKILQIEESSKPAMIPTFHSANVPCHIQHAELDRFLGSVRQKSPDHTFHVNDPKSDIIGWEADKLPNMKQLGKEPSDHDIFNLIVIDQWIEDNLQQFTETHQANPATCSEIKLFAEAYYKRASAIYRGHRELLSTMYLSVMELWIACHRIAVACNPILGGYSLFGVENIVLSALLFRRQKGMLRVSKAEIYLHDQSVDKLDINGSFERDDCFGTSFIKASPAHQALKATMYDAENEMMQQKLSKLNELKAKQKAHLDLHAKLQCDPTKCLVGTTNVACERCNHLTVANEMKISPYQKILPDNVNVVDAIIFELQIPAEIAALRDLSFFLQLNIAGFKNEGSRVAFSTYMKNYPPYAAYFKSSILESNPRICLASSSSTSRGPISVKQDTEWSEVCDSYPMKWILFDSTEMKYIEKISKGEAIEVCCKLELDDSNKILQEILCASSRDKEDNMIQNQLISMRREFESINLMKHTEELALFCSGDVMAWPNILYGLRGTSIDWAAPETFLVVTKVAFEASPRKYKSESRSRHVELRREKFTNDLLCEIDRLLRGYMVTFSGRTALAVFSTILIKLVGCGNKKNQLRSFHFLDLIRKSCFEWLQTARFAGQELTSEEIERQLELALIVVYTFNVDSEYLQQLLEKHEQAEKYVYAAAIVQESKTRARSLFQKSLYTAWLSVAVTASFILAKQVKDKKIDGIYRGLKHNLSNNMDLALDEEKLRHISGPWIKSDAVDHLKMTEKIIHFNLMSGEILIDGKSPMRLPDNYLRHPDFAAFFGQINPASIPVPNSIYHYQFQHPFRGFQIEIGLQKAADCSDSKCAKYDLQVRASKAGRVHVLVPRRILSQTSFPFPRKYIEDFFHWHMENQEEMQVDFYPCGTPWDNESISWCLASQPSGWLLKLPDLGHAVVPTTSVHYEKLKDVFQHFIAESDLSLLLNPDKDILEIHLGTLDLNFFVQSGSTIIRSVEFEDMCVDHHYSPATLIGLKSKMTLYNHRDSSSRILLIADGVDDCFLSEDAPTEITIAIKSTTAIQIYVIDEFLGRLKGNQTWRSKAYLAYLSALTSHYLPDPFTGSTGQETALDILTSGAIMSFDQLSPRDHVLLENISQLSQERDSKKKSNVNLPIIKWNPKLRPALHHEQYRCAVKRIIEHGETLKMFKNTSESKPQNFTDTEMKFMESEYIRHACFRTADYGAENGLHDTQDSNYHFRMAETKRKVSAGAAEMEYGKSASFQRSFRAALGAKKHVRFAKNPPSPTDILQHMTNQRTIKGTTPHYDAANFRYTPEWVNREICTLAQDFCTVHSVLTAPSTPLNPYRLRLWLGTVASGMDDDIATDLIPILSGLISDHSNAQFDIPQTTNVDASLGYESNAEAIAAVLHSHKRPFARNLSADISTNQKAEDGFIEKQNDHVSSLSQQIAANDHQSLEAYGKFFYLAQTGIEIRRLFGAWNINQKWKTYSETLSSIAEKMPMSSVQPPTLTLRLPNQATERATGHITFQAMMSQAPNRFATKNDWRDQYISQFNAYLKRSKCIPQPALLSMPAAMCQISSKGYETQYVEDLRGSIQALEKQEFAADISWRPSSSSLSSNLSEMQFVAKSYKEEIEGRLDARLKEATSAAKRGASLDPVIYQVMEDADVLPRISRRFLLSQLSLKNRDDLGKDWLEPLQQIAEFCRDLQHLNRILRAASNETNFLSELKTIERTQYNNPAFPVAVLLEIDQDVCLRRNQLEIAEKMRDPQSGENAVMQLNMGEGKSSMVIPILSASLADNSKLVQVFTGRHQFKQMMDTLTAALGGLMNRTVFLMPYNRESNLGSGEIDELRKMLIRCHKTGGVLLLQPEHQLSLLLSSCSSEDPNMTKKYVSLLKYFRENGRSIIDESDEILSPTYELLYTMGTPGPVDLAPDRWLVLQELLKLISRFANPAQNLVTEEQVLYQENEERRDAYPDFSFLTHGSLCNVLQRVARELVETGIPGFSTKRYNNRLKQAMFQFIVNTEPSLPALNQLKRFDKTVRAALALVRGCIAGDIFRVALLRKRWRVDYGCDFNRMPSTRLAVPFSAKDVPKPRSEFSNTDIVIVFTHLSYYRSGLREEDARELIEHMQTSDNGSEIYHQWFKPTSPMPLDLRSLKAINLQDDVQFVDRFYPSIKYSVEAINHFLSHLVFPTELSAFNQQLAASGWDLAAKSKHPTTGFSGTTDLCALLPLSTRMQDLQSQTHTNALVLNNILGDENTAISIHETLSKKYLDGGALLDHVVADGQCRVMIDVGAQILKLSNRQVAEKWLDQTTDMSINAVVFFDDSDVLSVLDRSNVVLPLKASIFAKNLDSCAVFLDEAHTRGTDLRLPPKYKAAVTLGPGLTKDRLTQGENSKLNFSSNSLSLDLFRY